ncbi:MULTISPECIES: hypothetical protein [Microcystis]|uniref:Uncharacterized protein n=2 Tax=Microcystis TaxID=1125 RepID=A0A402DIX3_MICAE|nr:MULTISPECIES: hypothetical protein [Microcystis]MBD2601624.1 hypothetical protein [Microcystis viridis FACHB-1342]MDB9388112.1 hypothetical protein [Microcystis aeruginosa CS-583]ODV35965.1 hypothetical protein BFG60_4536 [Microcystis aeruginosa NIES-98]GCE62171.1 hypothetical protein MiAbB_04116 [Microcystis aeruginosa NIES-4285]
MANIKINELKNTVTDEIIEFRTDAANDSPESITAFKTLRQVVGGCCRWCCCSSQSVAVGSIPIM